jgi:hypothetical protein
MAERSAHWKWLMAGSAVALAAAFIAPRFIAAPDLDENRPLAEAPIPPHDEATLEAFPKDADRYVADHFPPRAQLIGALNFVRLRLGVSGSPRVIVGRDGWLFYDDNSHMGAVRGHPKVSDAEARIWLGGLAARTEQLRGQNAAYLVVAAPDKEAVYPEHGPAWFVPDPDRNALRLPRLAAQAQAGAVVYPLAELAAAKRAGVKVYEPYETHWTGLGAYEGYAAIMRRLQAMGLAEGPRPLSDFAYVRHPAWETPRNLALMLGIASFVPIDHPEVDDPAIGKRLTTTYLTEEYDWTKPRVVDTGRLGKPVLLMTMDSFSTALLPFLYGDFSRIVLSHNQDGVWRQDLIDRFKPDIVITEVVESGLPFVMQTGPSPSAAALARIDQAIAHPLKAPPEAASVPARQPGPRAPRRLEPVQGHVAQLVYGGPRDDRIDGTEGDDAIYGRGGNDTLHGLGGDDMLRGGKGDDRIDGGDGDDQIWGDKGDDTLTGGRGADTFHAAEGADLDLVLDYSAAEGDRVMVDGGAPYTVRQQGADTVIELRGSRMVLKGVRLATLPRGWIMRQGKP